LLRVLAPKVRGSWLLHQLTREDPLDLFILHSAIVSVFGNEGQAAYAAANAFLDSLAHYRRSLGLCGLSVNWGAWGETGAATTASQAVEKVAIRHGISFMPPREALLALESAMAGPHAQVAIFAADWEKFAAGLPAHTERSFLDGLASLPAVTVKPRPDHALAFRKRLEQTSPERIPEVLEMHVREIAASVLGVKNGDSVDSRRPLHELGMDSLMAVEMRNALARTLDRTLPATLLYDYPTVELLSAHLFSQLRGGNGVRSADPPARLASALGEIEALTDEEVERLFAKKAMRKHAGN
jgi:acyl carrier protein